MSKALSKKSSEKAKRQQIDECSASSSDLEDEQPLKNSKCWVDKPTMKRGSSRTPASSSKEKMEADLEEENDSEGNVKKLMSVLGMDFDKTLEAKKRKLTKYTDAVLETHVAKVDKILIGQKESRNKLLEEFGYTTSEALTNWGKDLKTVKEQESKLLKLFEQHIKTTQQVIGQESQRVASLRKLQDEFATALKEMEAQHKDVAMGLNTELRKNLDKVYKKIVEEHTQQALANARNSFFEL